MQRTEGDCKAEIVYLAGDGGGGPVKIGHTTATYRERLRQLRWQSNTNVPTGVERGQLQMLAVIIGARSVETAVHKELDFYAIGREWFRLVNPVEDFLAAVGVVDPLAAVLVPAAPSRMPTVGPSPVRLRRAACNRGARFLL